MGEKSAFPESDLVTEAESIVSLSQDCFAAKLSFFGGSGQCISLDQQCRPYTGLLGSVISSLGEERGTTKCLVGFASLPDKFC